jgi:hypothetical protein
MSPRWVSDTKTDGRLTVGRNVTWTLTWSVVQSAKKRSREKWEGHGQLWNSEEEENSSLEAATKQRLVTPDNT